MKKISFVFNFAFLILNCTAQTNVSGFINANTTWNLSCSPYIGVGNTILLNGYTLTVDPVVEVKFDSAKSLQIHGELHAVGTSTQSIIFTSNQAVLAAGNWGKIQFSSLSTGAVFDAGGNYLSGSIMKYCAVAYGGGLGYGAIFVNSSLYISCCSINYSGANGISSSGFVKTDSTSVRNCVGSGMSISGMSSPYCPYTITYDTLEYNANGGIVGTVNFPNCTNRWVHVTNCYFGFNSGSSALFNVTKENILIRENKFLNNSSSSSDGAAISRVGGNSIIECNLFLNNQSTSISAIQLAGDQNDTIRKNRFEDNVCTQFGSLIEIFVFCCGKKVISDNYFLNNSSPNGKLLFLRGWDSGNDITQFFVTGNEFNNGLLGSEIYLYASAINPNLQFVNISNNNFLSDSVQYVIENASSFNGPSMHADSNYWNSTSTQHIDSMIYDFFDNANYSVVYYSPILSSPVLLDTACSGNFQTGSTED